MAQTVRRKRATYRIFVGRGEIGSAWSKDSPRPKAYLLFKLDDPSFRQPIFASLFLHTPGEYALVWSRSRS